MAQRGGTYRPEAAAAAPALSNSSSRTRYQNSDSKDKQVPGMEEGGDNTRAYGGLTPSDHTLELANAPPEARKQAHGKTEDQDWELVQRPGDKTGEKPPDLEIESHFDITLGWGRYKLKVFGWDLSVRKESGDSSQSSPRNGR